MPATTALEREKLEVEAVLASGIFSRAPNLALLLNYVCTKYFDGAADEIKEYNIAVEALGRPAEFDQKRDSIVRVEAHRLRRRLREYYEDAGSTHEIQIEIPSGQYTPHFIPRPAVPQVSSETQDNVMAVPAQEVTQTALATAQVEVPVLAGGRLVGESRPSASWFRWAILMAICLTAGVLISRQIKQSGPVPLQSIENPVAALPLDSVRILAGVENGSYIDTFGRTWQSDRYFNGGWVNHSPQTHVVLGTRDQELYRNRREGPFRYDIPLKAGVYELRLHFAESVFGDNNIAGGGETTRIFYVMANGTTLLQDFDPIGDAGASVADIKVFRDISPSPDGQLHLDFRQGTNLPFVNAIELIPGTPGRIRPIRMVARDRGLKDNEGRYWDPDGYVRGGQLIARPQATVQAADPELYRGERYGNITYTIPVAQPGRYGVSLYFAENWFGSANPGGGGIGDRIFDILINGVALRRNFDIFKESAGASRAVVVSVHGVAPNHQGKLVISLIPARNYACINALEIVDETKDAGSRFN